MKLSEAMNNKISNTLKNGEYYARIHEDSITYAIETKDRTTIVEIPLDGWEEIKPPRQWSEKELMLFKLLPDWAKWISKDGDDGSVFVYSEIPVKNGLTFKNNGGKNDFVCQTGTVIDDFLTITFEESPVYIGDLKG